MALLDSFCKQAREHGFVAECYVDITAEIAICAGLSLVQNWQSVPG